MLRIEEYLRRHPIANNKYRLKVGEGRSQTIGIVGKRCMAPDISRTTWNSPLLFSLLMEWASENVPIPFTSIQINDNYHCVPHYDKGNIGDSYIIGFGDYTGGELKLWDTGELVDIRNGFVFNGSERKHSTEPWVGRRFSLVFHTVKTDKSLEDYLVKEIDGKYWVYDILNDAYYRGNIGLPHPLKGRKVP